MTAVVTNGSIAATHVDTERRSPRWEGVRRAFLAKNPWCAVCGESAPRVAHGLNVHHVVPVEFVRRAGRPDLELDERNLITLCEAGENHHLVVGHLGDWRSYDPEVRTDVALEGCRGESSARIEGAAWWKARRAGRPKHCAEMTEEEVRGLRAALEEAYPTAGVRA